MEITNLQIDYNCGNNFHFDRLDPKLGHLFVLFKSDAEVLTKNGYVHAKPGNFIFYNQNERMEYWTEDWPFHHDFFRFFLTNEDSKFFTIPTATLFTCGLSDKLKDIFHMLTIEYFSVSKSRKIILDLLGRLFLINTTDFVKTDATDKATESHYQTLFSLRLEILTSPQKEWTIQSLSKKAMMSPCYFQNLYKQIFGISCMNEIINARIKKAKNLLLSQNKKENEIASLCGYNNVEHFIRQFKKRTGVTPSQYKKQHTAPTKQT